MRTHRRMMGVCLGVLMMMAWCISAKNVSSSATPVAEETEPEQSASLIRRLTQEQASLKSLVTDAIMMVWSNKTSEPPAREVSEELEILTLLDTLAASLSPSWSEDALGKVEDALAEMIGVEETAKTESLRSAKATEDAVRKSQAQLDGRVAKLGPALATIRSAEKVSLAKLEGEKAQLALDLNLFVSMSQTLNLCESLKLTCEAEKEREKNVRQSLFTQREKVDVLYAQLIEQLQQKS